MIFKNSFSELQTSKVAMLRVEEELLLTRFLMERLTDAVFWITSDAQIIYVNYAACSLVGYPYEELVSKTIHNIILDFPLEVWPNYWKSIKQQGSLYFESLYKTLKEQCFPVEISATYMEYEAKEYVCILIRDISKRKQASFSLDKSNQTRLQKQAATKEYYAVNFSQTIVSPLSEITKSLNSQSIFPSDSHLSQVFEYIEANYHQPISLQDVAFAVGYCPAYLTDLVRRHTGQTVNHWIVERRMVAARTLLLESNLCVNQIAETVGYQHEGHFFRQFRQHHKTTPQAWRKTQLLTIQNSK
ncbi:helix-turn-helix domain-containing protein [Nostoc sp.]|uniref:helix-turn-helix domain-containing protein n=1 Tax=Nostoc sp. TaxID=1180 RepID=UPI002FF4407E